MELLQKLTLYDLIGYTMPGIIFLWICISNGFLPKLTQIESGGTVYWCVMIIIGYIVGIIIAEIMEFFVKLVRGLCKIVELDKYYWDNLGIIYGISEEELKCALKKSKGTDIGPCNGTGEILSKYMSYMYSDVQTDEKYSRLHNYASAELLYKNMTAVFMAALAMKLWKDPWPEVIIYIIGTICFVVRHIRFKERKIGYVACWFIQKHLTPPVQ